MPSGDLALSRRRPNRKPEHIGYTPLSATEG